MSLARRTIGTQQVETFPREGMTVAHGGGGPHDPGMEERVAKLEATLDTIRAEMRASSAELKAEMSTFRATVQGSMDGMRIDAEKLRADVVDRIGKSETATSRWALGLFVTIILAAFGLWLRFGGVTPTALPAQQQPQPIIITVPAQPAATVPPTTPSPSEG